jgi:lipid-A-disaccharide synthase
MRIFFSVGEPSGDLHGANLVRQLRGQNPAVQCVGYGGPHMAAAGCDLHADLTQFAVMFLLRVLLNIHHFYRLWRQAGKYFQEHRPDAVVLIDYPGFNWWIARSAKRYNIPVFYYGVPQMWAWAGWRVKKMRKLVDYSLCKLPFEVGWFSERGCRATYVGHPYFDEVHERRLDAEFVNRLRDGGPLVTILPGSRTQEVLTNLPTFLEAASQIKQQVPTARLAIASFNERQASIAREMVAKLTSKLQIPIEIHIAKTPELIEAAYCCMACSGSVSLELLYHEKPTVILYRISRTAFWFNCYVRKAKYITLVNLLATDDLFPKRMSVHDPDDPLAEQVPYPEYLTCDDRSQQISAHIIEWLTHRMSYQLRIAPLRILKQKYAQPGASARAAQFILSRLQEHCLDSSRTAA